MAWLAGGVVYSVLYLIGGWLLHGHAHLLLAFRVSALLVPPMTGVVVAAFVARKQIWGSTYRRLSVGLLVNFIILSITNAEIWQGIYRSGFVYDVVWIMPFAFYPWAATLAPSSAEADADQEDRAITPSRPWIVFGALGLIPLADYGLRRAFPLGPLEGFRDLFTAITVFSVLPLLMARLAVERGE